MTYKDPFVTLKTLWRQERKVYKELYQCWQNDTNIFRKIAMPSLFLTYLLPMRFWNFFPYPSALAAFLAVVPLLFQQYLPHLCSEELFFAYMLVFIGPLYEAFLTGVMYYWIPGGKEMLCSFFYSENIFRLFVGNPISNLKKLGVAAATIIAAKAVSIGHSLADSWANLQAAKQAAETAKQAAETAKQVTEAAKQAAEAAQVEIDTIVKNGGTVSKEEIQAIFKKYQDSAATTPKNGTTISTNLGLSDKTASGQISGSHSQNGMTFNGQINVNKSLETAKRLKETHEQTSFISSEKK